MPSATFTFDADIAFKRFSADAVIVGNRLRHDRTNDHTGTQDTTTVVLSDAIGGYAAGTTVQAVLADLAARLVALESSTRRRGSWTVDAFIRPRFVADAVIRRTITPSGFTANAAISLSGPGSFTLNAVIKTPDSSNAQTFTIGAFLV
jgi:hypothetical protein